MKQEKFRQSIPWALYILSAVCYVSLIFNRNVWLDEAFTATLVNADMPTVLARSMSDTLPPLYNILLKGMTDLFGYRIPVMKLTSVLPMLATLLLGPTVIKKRHGLMSAVLFLLCITLMPLMLHYGIEIRMYSLGFFFATASAVYAYEAILEPAKKNWILFTLFSVLAGYSHHFAFVTVGFVYLFVLLYYLISDREHIRRFFFCLLATFLLYLPCLLITLQQFRRVSGYFSMPEITLKVFLRYMICPFITGGGIVSALLALAVLLLVIRSLLSLKSPKLRTVYALSCFFTYYGVLVFGTVISKIMTANIFVDRYLFFSCGMMWLFFAIETPCLPDLKAGTKKIPAGVPAVLLVILAGIFTYRGEWITEYGTDPDEMINYLQANVTDGDGLATVSETEALYFCLPFYEPGFRQFVSVDEGMEALDRAEVPALWIASDDPDAMSGVLDSLQDEGLTAKEKGSFAFDRYAFTLYRVEEN
ncbi:MAG: glycosyltransferase family 39 protein [Lachnospiraceae bacterium]|nr:glycosyltransferase family 39 protein [Lachnospiraceae bacterium]